MKKGVHIVEGNEHNEWGYRDETSRNRTRMMEKRMKKLESARKDLIRPKIWGNKAAEVGIIGCGSTFGPIREAMEQLSDSGIETKFLQIRTLWPFLEKEVKEFLSTSEKVFVVDNNYEAQLAHLIKSKMNIPTELTSILNYSGQTFRPREISEPIRRAF
jgi:2-oxoglutarate ferredoxin oxidoreductase subunit alpha